MNVRAASLCVLVFVASAFFGGCLENEIVDDISTEITVTAIGPPGEEYDVRKRFRFSRSPEEAASTTLDGATLLIVSPEGTDLSFLHRITVWAEVPESDELVLLAEGEGFEPGDRFSTLEIVYTDDLAPLISSDARATLIFRVQPNQWYRPYPEGGITILAGASVVIAL